MNGWGGRNKWCALRAECFQRRFLSLGKRVESTSASTTTRVNVQPKTCSAAMNSKVQAMWHFTFGEVVCGCYQGVPLYLSRNGSTRLLSERQLYAWMAVTTYSNPMEDSRDIIVIQAGRDYCMCFTGRCAFLEWRVSLGNPMYQTLLVLYAAVIELDRWSSFFQMYGTGLDWDYGVGLG